MTATITNVEERVKPFQRTMLVAYGMRVSSDVIHAVLAASAVINDALGGADHAANTIGTK